MTTQHTRYRSTNSVLYVQRLTAKPPEYEGARLRNALPDLAGRWDVRRNDLGLAKTDDLVVA